MIPTRDSPTLAPPRISLARFKQLLIGKNSPAVPEASLIYGYLVQYTVDPSFALAHFRVESQYGTSGFATETNSWGNMLYDPYLTINNVGTITKSTSDGYRYTYATYANYAAAIIDYVRYIHHYIDIYDLSTIYGATGRWLGINRTGTAGHINYVTAIINDMIEYEYPTGGYNTGDKMIYAGPAFDRKTGRIVQKYPVTVGMELYRSTSGDFLKKFSGTPGNAWWLGFPNNDPTWGALFIGTTLADPDATLVYIKNPVRSKIINI